MKKVIGYFIISLSSILVGIGIMYIYLEANPLNKTIIEKKVSISDTGISEGIKNIYDSVVVVENYNKSKLVGIGSGFIYDKEGYIMTNQHVVANATEIKITLMDGQVLDAQIIGGDEFADIAVIKIDKKYVKNVATLSSSNNVNLGDTVFTIGSPVSTVYAGTVTRGILSGKNRMVEVSVSSTTSDWIMNVMQTDAAINPGNSGGPLCNVNGEVIGINSMKLVENSIEGLGFAIPIEDALEYANKIVNKEEIKRAYLGISMTDMSVSSFYKKQNNIEVDDSITSGVIVIDTVKNGPCDLSGIKKNDVIIKIGNNNIKNIAELRYYLYKNNPNDKVELEVIRETKHIILTVTLGESE